jgi:hypothetical protein
MIVNKTKGSKHESIKPKGLNMIVNKTKRLNMIVNKTKGSKHDSQ